MRVKAGLIILLGLFLIMGTVSAASYGIADKVTIRTDKEGPAWIASNNVDTAVISIEATNNSGYELLPNVGVTFTVDNPAYGWMNPPTITVKNLTATTATSTFTVYNKSGTAVITATITSPDGSYTYTKAVTVDQKIDHDLPQSAVFDTPATLPVGSVSSLNITLKDRWGNRIDNRNTDSGQNHTVILHMAGGGGVWDGSQYNPSGIMSSDGFGNASATIRISNVSGPVNQLYIDPVGNMITGPVTWIEGIADRESFYISQLIPAQSTLFANAQDRFGLYYYVYDRYMNPISNTTVNITASDGTRNLSVTNTDGAVFYWFGPKDIANTYTVRAAAVSNTSGGARCIEPAISGYCSQNLTFAATDPTDIVVTANPISVTSLDASPLSRGKVLVRVVDIMGNSVPGQKITFSMGTPSYSYNCTEAQSPALSPLAVTTGDNGFAEATFTPGAFPTSGPQYNATATGQVTVTATWTNAAGTITKSRNVTFYWKNYPYLSISVPPEVCDRVTVGDKVNISMSLLGDGAALMQKPIDVVLLFDRSGSMEGDRLAHAKNAANIFIDAMKTGSSNQVGTVSFSSATTKDQSLTTDFDLTKVKINKLGASGYTQMRRGLYDAITDVRTNGRAGAVKAVILLTDGDWNYDGSIIAHGTGWPYPSGGWHSPNTTTCQYTYNEQDDYRYIDGLGGTLNLVYGKYRSTDGEFTNQNMSIYAKNSGVRLYTLSFEEKPSAYVQRVLRIATNNTGGFYQHAADKSELNDLYRKIAGELTDTAGGETEVYLDFGVVNINDHPATNITEYMDYQYVPSPFTIRPTDSTYFNKTRVNTTSGGLDLYYEGVQDDTANWSAKKMTFNAGTIKLNDQWSTSFRLNLTQAGKIELFGSDSSSEVCFRDASTDLMTCQKVPALYCNIRQQEIDYGTNIVLIDNLAHNNGQDFLTLTWNTTYTGGTTVKETLQYKSEGETQFHTVPGGIYYVPPCSDLTRSKTVDTTKWSYGSYTFQITGSALDAPGPITRTIGYMKVGPVGTRYINLE
jgi:Mg-chelatase subunit ChlD